MSNTINSKAKSNNLRNYILIKIVILILMNTSTLYAEITVACASNMQYAMKEIIDVYKSTTGKTVSPVFGSSGKLSAQIINGAPFDIFVSANMTYGENLYALKLTTQPPKIYASGILVLWTLKDLDLSKGLEILKNPEIKSIAIGDLKLTVYGPAAQQTLEKSGLWEITEPKLVFGSNINTVAQYIVNQSADIGFSNLSFTQQGPLAGKGKWMVIDSTLYAPIPQGANLLRYGKENNSTESKAFFEFLYSENARVILKKNGYTLP